MRPEFRLEVFKCTTTKLSLAKIAVPSSYSLLMSRLSTPKKVSPMNRSAASPAAIPVRLRAVVLREHPAKCSTLSALSAELPARFPSSPEMTVLYFAATASRTEDNLNNINKGRSARNALFYCVQTSCTDIFIKWYEWHGKPIGRQKRAAADILFLMGHANPAGAGCPTAVCDIMNIIKGENIANRKLSRKI